MTHIITAEAMQTLEQALFSAGVDSLLLMERAGKAVADVVYESYSGRPVVVLAGTGNNGGDGFIVAEELRARGIHVTVAAVNASSMKGDAFRAMQLFKGAIIPLSQFSVKDDPVVVDALFGIGIDRTIEGDIAAVIDIVNKAKLDVISVDIPSGIEANTGKVLGTAIHARLTVTFAYKKYGHVLLPGRLYCGETLVADIGLDEDGQSANIPAFENSPLFWLKQYKWPRPEHHKYDRGHALIYGGGKYKAGAAKLSGLAALRTGAGLVTISCREEDALAFAASAYSLMTMHAGEWPERLKDARCNAVVIGPGAGTGDETREAVLSSFAHSKRVVLDADALTAFEGTPESLFFAIQSPCILTPHEGEFKRIFPSLTGTDKATAARKAAKLSHAVVIYKGYDSVIAAPDGRVAVNTNALPYLATAGAGDVLSGICAGLMAQGMEAFEAACAATWIHGETSKLHGPGLIAEDIVALIPRVLHKLRQS